MLPEKIEEPTSDPKLPAEPRNLLGVLYVNFPTSVMTPRQREDFIKGLETIACEYRKGEHSMAVNFHIYENM
jgi:hypothetical protein